MKNTHGIVWLPVVFIIAAVLLGGVVGYAVYSLPSFIDTESNTKTAQIIANHNTNSIACTEEAKLCPDGTAVGRTGPNCEFAACPGETNTNTSVDLTADWETYTNDTYGYSIRYPKGWVYDAMFLESVVFNSESTGQWRLSVDMEPTARSVQENIDTPIHNSLGEATHLQGDEWERSTRTIDGQQAIRIVARELHPGDYGDTKTLVVNDGFLYTLSQGTGSDPIESAMVDSLKFTSRKTIADWKTYTNDEFGFSFKYPADYQLETGSGDVQLIARSFHPQGLLAFGVWRGEQEDCECELITHNGKIITVGDSQYNDSWETDYMWSTFQFTDETADWKTYTNTKHNFSIKLPDEWNPVAEFDGRELPLTGTSDSVTIASIDNDGVDESFIVQTCNMNDTATCAQQDMNAWKQQFNFQPVSDSSLTVSGFDVGRPNGGQLYYVREAEAGYLYIFVSQAAEHLVQTILSTFQFTDITTVQATDDSASLSPEDQQALESIAFAAVDQKRNGQWDRRIDIGRVDESQNAVVGYWWAQDRWQWIAWRQTGGDWNILVSFDGFDCTELESLPIQYESFFHNVIYIPSGEKYCFSHASD